MNINKDRFKESLVRDKEWLRNLYLSDSSLKSKRLITFASDAQLDTIIKFLHLLTNGVIKTTKECFEKIGQTQLNFVRKHFESPRVCKKLLLTERSVKLKKLNKLLPIMNCLLFTLFNEL